MCPQGLTCYSFEIPDLYDNLNFVKVVDCLEAVIDVAEKANPELFIYEEEEEENAEDHQFTAEMLERASNRLDQHSSKAHKRRGTKTKAKQDLRKIKITNASQLASNIRLNTTNLPKMKQVLQQKKVHKRKRPVKSKRGSRKRSPYNVKHCLP